MRAESRESSDEGKDGDQEKREEPDRETSSRIVASGYAQEQPHQTGNDEAFQRRINDASGGSFDPRMEERCIRTRSGRAFGEGASTRWR